MVCFGAVALFFHVLTIVAQRTDAGNETEQNGNNNNNESKLPLTGWEISLVCMLACVVVAILLCFYCSRRHKGDEGGSSPSRGRKKERRRGKSAASYYRFRAGRSISNDDDDDNGNDPADGNGSGVVSLRNVRGLDEAVALHEAAEMSGVTPPPSRGKIAEMVEMINGGAEVINCVALGISPSAFSSDERLLEHWIDHCEPPPPQPLAAEAEAAAKSTTTTLTTPIAPRNTLSQFQSPILYDHKKGPSF